MRLDLVIGEFDLPTLMVKRDDVHGRVEAVIDQRGEKPLLRLALVDLIGDGPSDEGLRQRPIFSARSAAHRELNEQVVAAELLLNDPLGGAFRASEPVAIRTVLNPKKKARREEMAIDERDGIGGDVRPQAFRVVMLAVTLGTERGADDQVRTRGDERGKPKERIAALAPTTRQSKVLSVLFRVGDTESRAIHGVHG